MNKSKKSLKNSKAITLISLVVTIIILIILAGISINLVLRENGLIEKTKLAAEESKYATAEEKVKMAVMGSYDETATLNKESLKNNLNNIEGIYEKVQEVTYDLNVIVDGYEFKITEIGQVIAIGRNNNILPENTVKTEAGKEVKMPEGWYTVASAYVSTEDGSIVQKEVKVASVTAIATGSGESVPVPQGFYYVGGTISSGVVISDDLRDKNKYAGIEDVPAGAVYNSDGTVKTYTAEEYENLTEEQKKEVLLGNQFVWIPVTESEYVKKIWGKNANNANTWNATWETQSHSSELPQIEKYGGFYIGRYEAGTSDITLSTGVNFANQNPASNWVNDNFSIREGLNNTVTGKITTKAGEIPYYHTDYFTALKLSNSMYQTDYVRSGMVTGTMWDAMMKFIAGNDDEIVTKSTWGNYTNGSVTYTAGKGRYATVNSSSGAMTSAFTASDGNYYYGMKTTAISEDVKKKNLYDVAGNLWEWTQEASYPNNTVESYMVRGGGFNKSYADYPACYRGYDTATYTGMRYGFRPVLYIM